jgi:hypothetical protein
MDAVMYCFAALRGFARMTPVEVSRVCIEIAAMIRNNVRDEKDEYQLLSLPGRFTRLQLLCYLYVSFRQVAPDSEAFGQVALENDLGFDIAREYEEAKRMESIGI